LYLPIQQHIDIVKKNLRESILWSFLCFLSEVNTELEIMKDVWLNSLQCCRIWIKQIEGPISNHVVKKAWNPKIFSTQCFAPDKLIQNKRQPALNHNIPDAAILLTLTSSRL
jgi:hypothetical protein